MFVSSARRSSGGRGGIGCCRVRSASGIAEVSATAGVAAGGCGVDFDVDGDASGWGTPS